MNPDSPIQDSLLPTWMRVPGVPVFVYHGLAESLEAVPAQEEKYWVRASEFESHISRIVASGNKVLTLSQICQKKEEKRISAAVLTFDDGLMSDYSVAFPALRSKELPAEFFVTTSNVGMSGHASWTHLREMSQHGMSIQSHGHSHVDLRSLSRESMTQELEFSKKTLEDKLGVEVSYFAAPFGSLNTAITEEAFRIGYRAICSARSIPARPGARKIDRIVLHRGISLREFNEYLNRDPIRYLRRVSRSLLYRWPLRSIYPPREQAGAMGRAGDQN